MFEYAINNLETIESVFPIVFGLHTYKGVVSSLLEHVSALEKRHKINQLYTFLANNIEKEIITEFSEIELTKIKKNIAKKFNDATLLESIKNFEKFHSVLYEEYGAKSTIIEKKILNKIIKVTNHSDSLLEIEVVDGDLNRKIALLYCDDMVQNVMDHLVKNKTFDDDELEANSKKWNISTNVIASALRRTCDAGLWHENIYTERYYNMFDGITINASNTSRFVKLEIKDLQTIQLVLKIL